nr:Na+/H+ antiporter [Auraticoccus cholistanensis]
MAMTVILVASLSRRFGLPSPLVLTVVGLAASFLPFTPDEPFDPDLILVGLLPPLLYAAAVQVSLIDFKRESRAIVALSVGLVVFTMLTVGLTTWWLLPVPLAAALALGAVVAPPDAVAATAVGRRIGLPRRLVTVLEGESLVNDATAIVLLGATSAAIVGVVTPVEVGVDFALSVLVGGAVGIAVALLLGQLHRRLPDPRASTALALVTPWLAFLPAEMLHGSGVLAVVLAGLLLAHKAPVQQTATARLSQRINWATVQYFLENAVFLMAGLQLAPTLAAVRSSELAVWQLVGVCAAVLVVAVLTRPVWVVLTARFIATPGRDGERLGRGELAVLSWAGMRGVVTLAAALSLPAATPHREVLVLAAMVVVAGTLIGQGATLPWFARRTGVQAPDARADSLVAAEVAAHAARAGLAELERRSTERSAGYDPSAVDELRQRSEHRVNMLWESVRAGRRSDQDMPGETYRRLRLEMLAVERAEVLRLRDSQTAESAVLQEVLDALDLEEANLQVMTARFERATEGSSREQEEVAHTALRDSCEHLSAAEGRPDPEPSGETCLDCVREGTTPVHLRICLGCGNVGCCDSSPGRHATAHHERSGHPVMRSFESGESWRWCYVDDRLG